MIGAEGRESEVAHRGRRELAYTDRGAGAWGGQVSRFRNQTAGWLLIVTTDECAS
jgi:hypothetical protein